MDGATWRVVPELDLEPIEKFVHMIRERTSDRWLHVWLEVSGWPSGLDIAAVGGTRSEPAVKPTRREYWDWPLWEGHALQVFVYRTARRLGLFEACVDAVGATLDAIYSLSIKSGCTGSLRVARE